MEADIFKEKSKLHDIEGEVEEMNRKEKKELLGKLWGSTTSHASLLQGDTDTYIDKEHD